MSAGRRLLAVADALPVTVLAATAGAGSFTHGFIAPDDATPDVFVHQSAIETGGYRSPQDNQRVAVSGRADSAA